MNRKILVGRRYLFQARIALVQQPPRIRHLHREPVVSASILAHALVVKKLSLKKVNMPSSQPTFTQNIVRPARITAHTAGKDFCWKQPSVDLPPHPREGTRRLKY